MGQDFSSILVRSPNWIGDQVLAYPFFHYLRVAFPAARIAAACMPWVASIQYRDLVDEVIELPRSAGGLVEKGRSLEESARLLASRGPWDLGISLPNSLSAAWLLMRAGCRVRRGYRTDFRGWLLNSGVPWREGKDVPRADAYVGLLRALGPEPRGRWVHSSRFWGVPPENDLDPGIPGVVPGFDPFKSWGKSEVAPPTGDYWVLAPGSAAESRRWPLQYFMSFAQKVIEETGWPAVVVGGPAEAPLGKSLGELPKVLDRTAQGAVSRSWPLFRGARFTVANDSGLAHVAALCGSPVHVIWGAGDPKRTAPLGPGKVGMTFNPVDCWPCERNICFQQGEAKLRCLKGLSPELIWEDMQRGFKQTRRKQ